MTIKQQSKKYPKQKVSSTLYSTKSGKNEFKANIFIGDRKKLVGILKGNIGKHNMVYRSDATLEGWIDEAYENARFYSDLVEFLEKVRFLKNNEIQNKSLRTQ